MSKKIIPFTAQLVQFTTTTPFAEVISRLDQEVNKEAAGDMMAKFRASKTQDDLKSHIDAVVKNDFLYFSEIPHHRLLHLLEGTNQPGLIVYSIGNPLFAQAIVKHSPLAAYNIPPRLLIQEHPDGSGTTVSYTPASTVMAPGIDIPTIPDLKRVLDEVDAKLEKLVQKITAA